MLTDYKIEFSKDNPNVLQFIKDDKVVSIICCPPTLNGCDIIGFGEEIHSGYQFDFKGLIVVTNSDETTIYREVYHMGKLVAKNKKQK